MENTSGQPNQFKCVPTIKITWKGTASIRIPINLLFLCLLLRDQLLLVQQTRNLPSIDQILGEILLQTNGTQPDFIYCKFGIFGYLLSTSFQT